MTEYTNNHNLPELQIAAALADEIYRRDPSDFALLIDRDLGLNVQAVNFLMAPTRNGGIIEIRGDYVYGLQLRKGSTS